jgi:YegS/Rv2252/BmrU family lipid kinase
VDRGFGGFYMNYYFIINPLAASGRAAIIWRDLKQYLEKRMIPYEVFMTSYSNHALELANQLTSGEEKQKEKTIIVVGGDGTLNEVINGICISAAVTIGYIPAGSGNDFARSMKISTNPRKALHKILQPEHIKWIDYGTLAYMDSTLQHRRFVVSSGMGYDAAVCEELFYTSSKKFFNKLHLGRLTYVGIGLRKVLMRRSFDCTLELDGVRKVPLKNVSLISVHNQPFEGGGFCFSPQASPEDGVFDICVIAGASRLRLLRLLFWSLTGKHVKKKGVKHYRCSEFAIQSDRLAPVHADGEICGYLQEISYVCENKKIRIIV